MIFVKKKCTAGAVHLRVLTGYYLVPSYFYFGGFIAPRAGNGGFTHGGFVAPGAGNCGTAAYNPVTAYGCGVAGANDYRSGTERGVNTVCMNDPVRTHHHK